MLRLPAKHRVATAPICLAVLLGLLGWYPVAAQSRNDFNILDLVHVAAGDVAMAIGADGLPIISYQKLEPIEIKLAHCNDQQCSSASITKIAANGHRTYRENSLAIGADGLPVIAYHDANLDEVRFVHCSNAACSIFDVNVIEGSASTPDVFGRSGVSVTIGSSGLPVVVYVRGKWTHDSFSGPQYDSTLLRIASCENVACTSATISEIDLDERPMWPVIDIAADSRPVISWHSSEFGMRFAHCGDSTCTGAAISTVDPAITMPPSPHAMTMGGDGRALIAYLPGTSTELRLARCSNHACSSSLITTIDSDQTGGLKQPSVATGSDGYPVIAYHNDGLKVAHCENPACTASTIVSLHDELNAGGAATAIAVGTDGYPVIAYDDWGRSLNVAHCDYVACQDNTPPRWPAGATLTVSALTESTVAFSWPTAVDDVAVVGYRVYQDGEMIAVTAANTRSYLATALTAGATYRFTVQAGDADDNWSTDGPSIQVPTALPQIPTVGLVDPTHGLWHLRDSGGDVTSFFYGNPGDVPFMGDWDCDGVATPGLFRLSDAFAYLRNANTVGIADIRFFFGNPSDVPLAGDFDGDGCDTLSIYRPSEQRFYIVNQLGKNEGGLGAAEYLFAFGNPGDKPVVGDWDGDGIDEVGLHRESTGFFYYRNTLDTGIADGEFYFGDPGDRFVAGDWGVVDGTETPAVFRPRSTTFYFRHTNTPGTADSEFVWGESGWIPVSGQFGLD